MIQRGTKSSFYGKVLSCNRYFPQLNGALQHGTEIRTNGWPPGYLIEAGHRFHIPALSLALDAPTFTATEKTRANSEGFAIIKITPPLGVNTVNQAVLYSDRPVLDAIH